MHRLGGAVLPLRPGRQRLARVDRARHQRRAEDDGRHDPRAHRQRALDEHDARPGVGEGQRRRGDRAGTYLGGWRIIRTLGKGLVDITPRAGHVERRQHRGRAAVGEPPRVRPVDHPRGHRLGARWRPRPRHPGALVDRRPDGHRVGTTFPIGRPWWARCMWWIGDSVGGALGASVVFVILVGASRRGSSALAPRARRRAQRQRRVGAAPPARSGGPVAPRSPRPRPAHAHRPRSLRSPMNNLSFALEGARGSSSPASSSAPASLRLRARHPGASPTAQGGGRRRQPRIAQHPRRQACSASCSSPSSSPESCSG